MYSKLTSRGFSAVIGLLVVVVIAGLAFGGWYVWKKNQRDDASNKTNKTSQASQDKDKKQDQPDPYEGWQMYNNATYGISFKYPADWKLDEVPVNAPTSATKQEYGINLKRSEDVKYNNTVSIEVLGENLADATAWYDESFASSEVTKTTNELKGTQSVQYVVNNAGVESRLYLFAVGSKTYALSSVNEELNVQSDASYWVKFNGILDSLKLNATSN